MLITENYSYIFPKDPLRTNFNVKTKFFGGDQINLRFRFKEMEKELQELYDVEAMVIYKLDVSYHKLISINIYLHCF